MCWIPCNGRSSANKLFVQGSSWPTVSFRSLLRRHPAYGSRALSAQRKFGWGTLNGGRREIWKLRVDRSNRSNTAMNNTYQLFGRHLTVNRNKPIKNGKKNNVSLSDLT